MVTEIVPGELRMIYTGKTYFDCPIEMLRFDMLTNPLYRKETKRPELITFLSVFDEKKQLCEVYMMSICRRIYVDACNLRYV